MSAALTTPLLPLLNFLGWLVEGSCWCHSLLPRSITLGCSLLSHNNRIIAADNCYLLAQNYGLIIPDNGWFNGLTTGISTAVIETSRWNRSLQVSWWITDAYRAFGEEEEEGQQRRVARRQALHAWMSKRGGCRDEKSVPKSNEMKKARARDGSKARQKRVWVVLLSDKESFSKQCLKGIEDWQGYRRKRRREWNKMWMETDRGQPMIQQGRAHVMYLSHIQFGTVIPPLLFCLSYLYYITQNKAEMADK